MLPPAHRLTRPVQFTAVVRSGARVRRGAVVVHEHPVLCQDKTDEPVRIGLIVGKSVGGSVVRHRVSRRLRAQLSARLNRFPAGAGVVVRALPEAAQATSAQLGQDLDRAIERLGHHS